MIAKYLISYFLSLSDAQSFGKCKDAPFLQSIHNTTEFNTEFNLPFKIQILHFKIIIWMHNYLS